MADERWNRLEEIYHAALQQPASERSTFIKAAAGGDADLVAEIEALLSYDERSAAFMKSAAIELAARSLVAPQCEESGAYTGTIGSYEILRPLGAGGMGEVYLAHDTRLARNVALKVLRPDLANRERVAYFRREALAASGLNHPNILTIYEIGVHEGTEFIATEHVEGMTLRARLKSGPIAVDESTAIALQIAEGLAAAHEAGVVHRDIKPENVMLRADGLIKILDFGIATRAQADLPRSSTATDAHEPVAGTRGYMSPEQRRGLQVDARTDLWSLGTVLYEMVTGRLPAAFTAAGNQSAAESSASAVDFGPLPSPVELAAIIGHALSPELDDRYTTAREMARDLREFRRALEQPSRASRTARPVAGPRRFMHPRTLSRVASLMVVLSVATAVLLVQAARNAGEPAVDSLGILPLENAGDIPEGEYLADGITASLRNRVSQLSSIRQAAASEAARYRRLGVSPAQAGRELGVAGILTGTLERRADTVVVKVQLFRTSDGARMWGQSFARPISDLLTLQTEITRDIADALGLSPRQPLGAEETRDPAAYQLHAKGRYHVLKRTSADLRKAVGYLQDAVTADPTYGRAYAKLADAYILLAMTSDVPPRESFPAARTAAERALEMDPTLSEARVSMGIIKFWYDWDWSGAEAEFKRALASERPDPAAHAFYGHLLSNLGDHTGALEQLRRALDYEPHSPFINALFAQCFYYQGRYDESLAHLQKTLELDPALWLTHNMMGRNYERKEMYAEALSAFDRATELGGSTVLRASAAYTLAASGRRDEARTILHELIARSASTYVPPSNLALIHLGLGEYEEALDWLEKAYRARDMLLTFLIVEPKWAELEGHARFTSLLNRMSLKP
jgi:serine/threonine-protein kinase